jgi:hypothetical protein
MTYPAPEGDGRLSRVHSAALRKEIGERLGAWLDLKPARMPPHLTMLVGRLRDEPSGTEPDRNQ